MKDLSFTIVVVNGVVDFKPIIREGHIVVSSLKSKTKGKGVKKKEKVRRGASKFAIDKGKAKQLGGKIKDVKLNLHCFICGRSYFIRECLKNENLNAILISNGDEVVTHINPKCKLNCLITKLGDLTNESSIVEQDLT